MNDYLPAASVLAPFALAAAALAMTPGPDMTLFLSRTINHSRAAGMATVAGAMTGLLVHSTLVAIGLSALLVASATAFTVLKIVGALYLVWLAVGAIRHGSSLTLRPGQEGRASLVASFGQGLLVNLLNPKIIVFFLTFLPQFVSADDPHAGAKLFVLGLVFICVGAPICLAAILAAHSVARVLKTSRRATRMMDYAVATILGAFAVKLVLARAG